MGQMPGLRRVTLNLNPEIGDRGARELSEALRDDVCLKGERCGTEIAGRVPRNKFWAIWCTHTMEQS